MYDLVVIGGGSGGLSLATVGREGRRKVALVEKGQLGRRIRALGLRAEQGSGAGREAMLQQVRAAALLG